jgi:hypothetical protein
VVESVPTGRLKTGASIGERLGRIVSRCKVGMHYVREIGEGSFSYRSDQAKIEAEATLDGLYVIRSNVALRSSATRTWSGPTSCRPGSSGPSGP